MHDKEAFDREIRVTGIGIGMPYAMRSIIHSNNVLTSLFSLYTYSSLLKEKEQSLQLILS